MKKITIDDERLADIAKIHERIPKHYKDWNVTSMDIELRLESMKLLMTHSGDEIAAIVEEQEVIAFIWYVISDVTTIKSLWVAPSYRRRGLAIKLKNYVKQQSSAAGVMTITSHVHPNNKKMIQLNHKLGYDQIGNEMIYKLEVPND